MRAESHTGKASEESGTVRSPAPTAAATLSVSAFNRELAVTSKTSPESTGTQDSSDPGSHPRPGDLLRRLPRSWTGAVRTDLCARGVAVPSRLRRDRDSSRVSPVARGSTSPATRGLFRR